VRTIVVERGIEAQPERVFDLLADHGHYDRFRGIHAAELIREGDPPPNGLGAVRRITSRPIRFDEEITAFERPIRLDYLILRVNAPYQHHGASIRLLEDRGRTIVEWTSRFSVPSRLPGVQERIWALLLARGFRRVLADIQRMLGGDGRSA
jgi:uncharacterized protein YndB with AHSA1/START domain